MRIADRLIWVFCLSGFATLLAPSTVDAQTITTHYAQQPTLIVPELEPITEGEVVPFEYEVHQGQMPEQSYAPGYDVSPDTNSFPAIQAPQPCYWIASSRGLPQKAAMNRCRNLDYFHRLSDGCLQRTNLPTLKSQIIPGVPVCIFIHGAFVDAESHQYECARTYNWIRQAAPHLPLQVIFYTWPSDASHILLTPLVVNQKGIWAANNAFYLADLIGQLPPECPVCLVGHSHGARAAVATMHLIGGGQIDGYSYPYNTGAHRRYRVVMAAAAFDRHWLNPGQKYDHAMSCLEGIVNLQNRGDWALNLYPLRRPLSRKAIGATGFTYWDRSHLGNASCKAIDLDVTYYVGLSHTWPHYYAEPTIARAIVPYTYFVDQR
ncbi:MAG: hypothetical protein KDA86_08370 [Planctomycetaceae bacterium]|nr:hypothetical protein [Planctomycetaceae bacterium]